MTQFQVHSPEGGFSGEISGVVFRDGAALVSGDLPQHRAALAYFRRSGYRVTDEAPAEPTVQDAPADVFDPADHNVVDVLAYLADADEDERARVLAAEEAGQARATILKKGPSGE
ncbi:hypothetical protein ACIOD1_13000 [Streptomyces sp. NPDC088097]|uniref:hypothetical protein n=1 Tax=Streptomyces sp. NPDC088097 TaxID=3365823 RepID=UPI00381F9F26